MATPQTPRARSALAAQALRYRSSRSSWSSRSSSSSSAIVSSGKTTTRARSARTRRDRSTGAQTFADVPIFYNEAKATGTLDKYTWQDALRQDDRDGRDPDPQPAAVRARGTGRQRRRDVAGRHRRHDQDRLLHREARPDASTRSLKAAGGYDSPESIAQAYKDYIEIYQNLYETVRAQDRARQDPGHRQQHRRGRGQGRRRHRPRPRACSR